MAGYLQQRSACVCLTSCVEDRIVLRYCQYVLGGCTVKKQDSSEAH
jgi:hypothetical protein